MMDKKVCAALKIGVGYRANAGALLRETKEVFEHRERADEICNQCEWKDVCLWFV